MSQHKGEHGTCSTIQVVAPISVENPAGYILINASDFDATVHELYEPKKAKDGDGDKSDGEGGKKPKKAKDGDK